MNDTATHGKVKEVGLNDLRAGMKLERNVMGRNDKILAAAGEVLSKKHIDKFKKYEATQKPVGPAIPRKNPKNKREHIQHGEFEGGYKLSHFNRGFAVSTSVASGDEVPKVDNDPTQSKLFQNAPTKSFAAGDTGIESPLIRVREMEKEIAILESTNSKLGGMLHISKPKLVTEAEHEARREALKKDNDSLIEKLRGTDTTGKRDEKKTR